MKLIGGFGKFTLHELTPLFVAFIFVGVPLHTGVAALGELALRSLSFGAPTETVTHTYEVPIILRNDGVPMNAYDIQVSFDPNELEVTEVTHSDVLCEDRFAIKNTIDNVAGIIHLVCGTTEPFVGTEATLAVLTVRPEASSTRLSLLPDSSVRLHDGFGTNAEAALYSAVLDFPSVD